jgi:hypothetical protein
MLHNFLSIILVDLTVHQALWQQTIECHPDQADFQYLTDTESHTQSVFLDFKTNLPLWQAIYDRIVA